LAQAGLVICIVSCVLSAIATNIYVLDLAQIIEAISRATIMLTMQLWIAGISNKDNLANRLSWYTVMITIAPILAPSVGGVIADYVSWQYCFIVLGVLSLVMLAAISMFRIVDRTEQRDQAQPLVKAKFAPMKTLREYREVISHSPLLPLCFSLAWMAWFDGGYMAIVSFLFVDELGLSAAQLGGIIMVYVAGAFLGRFPIMYIQKHYGPRATFIFHQAIVLLATVGALCYRLLTGHHDILEIAVMMFVFGFGFSGMYIYCLRNSMIIEPEKKSVYTSLFNALYSIAALLGVLTIQGLYVAKFTSVNIYQTLVATATVFMLVGTVLHLKALRKIDNKL
jgi:DHA1 family bicyclomycin/chloramphenicol resistance-like MFS transporter